MRVVVTGAQGQVSRALQEIAAAGAIEVVPLARPAFDLTALSSIESAIREAAPDVIVHAAAYTAVDKAEAEPDLARLVNAEGSRRVALAATALGAPLIHLSTDYVFDGTQDRPYIETDAPSPINVYGRTKLEAEKAVMEALEAHVIIRCSWVYSSYGSNFVRTMLRLAGEREEVSVVSDQRGRPTSANDIAAAVLAVVAALERRRDDKAIYGLFHLAPQGATSWAGFAETIFRCSRELGGPHAAVKHITTQHYPTPARRPLNSILDGSKFERTYGFKLDDWTQGVKACVQRILEEGKR